MELIVLGSSSKGNGYLITNGKESLLLEAGVKFDLIEAALEHDISSVQGCLITHEHGDHFKYHKKYAQHGIELFASKGTSMKSDININHIKTNISFKIGNFKIMPFDVEHDANEPLGFYINHPEMGNLVFLTDTHYSKYVFPKVNHFVVETNNVESILIDRLCKKEIEHFLYNRVVTSHMSLETCIRMLKSNDLTNVINIVAIHLSSDNSDAKTIESELIRHTGKSVHIARKGIKINLNVNPFIC